MEDLISVIVPAYNVRDYLSKCLDSILCQDYPHIEAIVVDDGSTDGTAEVLDAYAARSPQRITALHVKNGGVTRARLAGVRAAHGTWIGFVDADDYVERDMYMRLLRNAHEQAAQISHCGYRLVLPEETIYYYNTGRVLLQNGEEATTALLDGTYVEPGLCNKLFHKSLFAELTDHGKLDLSIRNNEDLLMNYYLFRQTERVIYEDFCPYYYILRPNSATTVKISEHKLKDPGKVMKILLEETKENKPQYAGVYRRYVRGLCNSATMMPGSQDDAIKAHRKETRKELRKELPSILTNGCCNRKLQFLSLWAGVLPDLYAYVHQAHILIKGLDKTRSLKK